MSVVSEFATEQPTESQSGFDAIVIGAGISGLRSLRMLRDEIGLSVRVFEAGSDLGGTWFWNRYPGARTDSESWVYCYEFDKDLLQEYQWTERFASQPEILRYLNHVADRFHLRRDIQFGTEVVSAVYDEKRCHWTVTTADGEAYTCKYLISAVGILSVAQEPTFRGLDSYQGEWYQSSSWPERPVSFVGKRVAVIGTGSTGVQIIPLVAEVAENVTVFQRTPNYVLPSRNFTLDESQRVAIKRDYEAIWAKTRQHPLAFPFDPANRVLADTPSDDERRRVLERCWETGTFRFLTQSYDDLLIDEECNALVAEFVRDKIRTIVTDPETAEKLCPKGFPIGSKRPPLGHLYYEAYNNEAVTLVDVRDNPIVEITKTGPRLEDGSEFDVDVIIFAIGFDAMTGPLMKLDPVGRAGTSIRQAWDLAAPEHYLAMCTPGFPNLFTVLGPQSPFSNAPVTIEEQVGWIRRAITRMRDHGADWMEADAESAAKWAEECRHALIASFIGSGKEAHSWFVGTNVEGKRQEVLIYAAGAAAYVKKLEEEAMSDFSGFRMGTSTGESAESSRGLQQEPALGGDGRTIGKPSE